MLAIGFAVIASIIVKAALLIGLAIGGAYALTTYVELPRVVDNLIWIAAVGYSLLCVLGLIAALGAIFAANRELR